MVSAAPLFRMGLAVVALACAAAFGEDRAALPPNRAINPVSAMWMTEVAVLPHGSTAFMTTAGDAVNAWSLLTYYWPEGAAAISLLAGSLWVWRLRRRPQRPGEPYCRRCNYCLTGMSAETCPECGAALTKRMRVIGRRRRLRLALALLLPVALPVAYPASVRFVPRQGAFSQWFHWWSTGLADLAAKRQIQWLADHVRNLQIIIEVDLASGQTLRTVHVCPSGESIMYLAVSADSSEILGVNYRHSKTLVAEVVRIAARSGRIRRVYPAELLNGSFVRFISPADDARTLYHYSCEAEELRALDTRTGAWSLVRRIDANKKPLGNGATTIDPPIIVAVGPDHRRLAIAEWDGEAHLRKPTFTLGARTYTLELWDGVERSWLAELGKSLPVAAMAASHDGSRLYAAIHGRGIVAWDLSRPLQPPWTVKPFESGGAEMTISPDDRWLFLARNESGWPGGQRDSIEVLDLARLEWADRLAPPLGGKVLDLSISGDGMHLVATCAFGGIRRQVVVYDLQELIATAPKVPPAGNDLAGAGGGDVPG